MTLRPDDDALRVHDEAARMLSDRALMRLVMDTELALEDMLSPGETLAELWNRDPESRPMIDRYARIVSSERYARLLERQDREFAP